MSRVRAKARCTSVNHQYVSDPSSVAIEVILNPVYNNGEENESWSKHTPSGEFKMLITNADAAGAFEVGKEYFVDFTPVD